MKKLSFQLFLVVSLLLLTATPAWAQDKVMQVHSGGEVVYESSTAQVDSVTFNDIVTKATGYIVGYHQCGLTIENGAGHAMMYYFVPEDSEETFQVHNFPQGVCHFPEELFETPGQCIGSRYFPETYRHAFKVQLEYTIDVMKIYALGLWPNCVVPAICWPGEIGLQIPILVYSAKK